MAPRVAKVTNMELNQTQVALTQEFAILLNAALSEQEPDESRKSEKKTLEKNKTLFNSIKWFKQDNAQTKQQMLWSKIMHARQANNAESRKKTQEDWCDYWIEMLSRAYIILKNICDNPRVYMAKMCHAARELWQKCRNRNLCSCIGCKIISSHEIFDRSLPLPEGTDDEDDDEDDEDDDDDDNYGGGGAHPSSVGGEDDEDKPGELGQVKEALDNQQAAKKAAKKPVKKRQRQDAANNRRYRLNNKTKNELERKSNFQDALDKAKIFLGTHTQVLCAGKHNGNGNRKSNHPVRSSLSRMSPRARRSCRVPSRSRRSCRVPSRCRRNYRVPPRSRSRSSYHGCAAGRRVVGTQRVGGGSHTEVSVFGPTSL